MIIRDSDFRIKEDEGQVNLVIYYSWRKRKMETWFSECNENILFNHMNHFMSI